MSYSLHEDAYGRVLLFPAVLQLIHPALLFQPKCITKFVLPDPDLEMDIGL